MAPETVSTSALSAAAISERSVGMARDVMAENMQRIEDAGYAIVLTVHDEILAEAPDTPEYNADHLAALLCTNPPWALDMPLAAAGFEALRYRKE